jgi:hypothetical protein
MIAINGIEEIRDYVGRELGVTEWHEVTQDAINAFADITGDHQWIHIDVDRAKATPFGGTIAHGLYVLSLRPRFTEDLVSSGDSHSVSTMGTTGCVSRHPLTSASPSEREASSCPPTMSPAGSKWSYAGPSNRKARPSPYASPR